LRQTPDKPAVIQRVTDTMARQTQQLVRLVDDLLEVGRINGGKLRLRKAPVQIAEVVRDAVAVVQPTIEAQQHELTVAIPSESIIVEADAARLTQVLANLLHNAARYTPRHGKLAVIVRHSADQVSISVRDNGMGIGGEALPHVFDMFYQANDTGEARGSGLGIGLTLAKMLIEMHEGTICAESAGPRTGSTFTVRLPLVPAAQVLASEASGSVSDFANRHRVLIVDDNTDAAETLRLLITTLWGGEVHTAFNGPDALALAAEVRPEVVLLDLGMPGMDGYEVARRLRRQPWGRDLLLIALTGWGQDHDRRLASEAGFDRHMTKPAEPEGLRAVLDLADARPSATPKTAPPPPPVH
jgi:CheY-like chemotaxis protein